MMVEKKKVSEAEKIEADNLMEEASNENQSFSRYSVASFFGIRSLRFSAICSIRWGWVW